MYNQGRVSDNLSTSAILEGGQKLDKGQKRIDFVSYVMVHIGTTNTIKSSCVLDISLKESNDSGGYYFIHIFTGKHMSSYNWKEVPITE